MYMTLIGWEAKPWPDSNVGAALHLEFEGANGSRWGIAINCRSLAGARRCCRSFDKQQEISERYAANLEAERKRQRERQPPVSGSQP